MNDKKTEPVTIPLLMGARSFFNTKKMGKNATLDFEVIQFIGYPIEMDRTRRCFRMEGALHTDL